MRILVLINSLACGGAERTAVSLSNHWQNCGYHVSVVTLTSEDFDFYKLNKESNRYRLNIKNEPKCSNLFVGVISNVRRIIKIRALLGLIKPDCVVSIMTTSNVLAILSVFGNRKIRTIVSERSYPPKQWLGFQWELLRKLTYRYADNVVVVSSDALNWLKITIPKAKGVVIPNGICLPLESNSPFVSPDDYFAPEDKLILFVGRLSPEKQPEKLLLSFLGIPESKRENWKIAIVGEGALRISLENLIRDNKAESFVKLIGHVGNVASWYRRSKIFVLSSAFEGFPNSLMEAMAHGCIGVSFDCKTGPKDIIEDGYNGYLVPDQDQTELQRRIEILINLDSKQLETISEIAAQSVIGKLSFENVAESWANLLDEKVPN